jgi:hypothetical protein
VTQSPDYGAELGEETFRIAEVVLRVLEFGPALGLQSPSASKISLPLRPIRAVLIALVLEREFEMPIAEVDAGNEASFRIEDLDVHLGLRESREHDRYPQKRLAR